MLQELQIQNARVAGQSRNHEDHGIGIFNQQYAYERSMLKQIATTIIDQKKTPLGPFIADNNNLEALWPSK